jgi:hypothetical protein
MASIFDLKTSVEELSSANEGTSRMEYDQHPPTRDVTGTNFPNGAIHFRWQTSGQKWWIPSRSYLRIRCSLTKANGTQLDSGDNIAPNMGLCASLFQNAEFRINDKTISRISDFMPQVDALETRLSKSRSWLGGIGSAVNFWDSDYKARQSAVVGDGLLIKELTNISISGPEFSRTDLGFDAAGGTGVDRNAAVYTESTGQVVFSQNGGAALPLDVSTLFPIGSYFSYVSIQGGAGTDNRLKKPAKVVKHINATTIQLETGVIGTDVGTDGRTDWVKQIASPNSEGNVARKVAEFELIWQPPLSIFKVGHGLPSGKYELVLNPQTASVYQKYAIQTLVSEPIDKIPNIKDTTTPTAGSNFLFNIVNMYFYCNTVEGPRADDITYLLDLEQTNCQSEQFAAGQQSFQQKNFDVSPSTYALSVAYQDARSGSDSRNSASIFKVSNDGRTANSLEQNLVRFFINYAGQNLPAPDADPNFTPLIDYTTQRYAESQIYSGAMFDTGGGESLDEYHSRGSYIYQSWPRDGTDRSTRVNVHQQFKALTDTTHMRLLLFSHSKQVARVRVQDGRVVDVQLEDA